MLKAYLARNRALLIVGVVVLILGLAVDVRWLILGASAVLYLVNVLPGFLLILAWFLASRYLQRRWTFAVLGIAVALLALLFAVAVDLVASVWVSAIASIEDVARYPEIRAQFGDSELVRHFPMAIPPEATEARFAYSPGFLQGATYIQLRLRLPPEEVADLLADYRPVAKSRFPNQLGGGPPTHFYTSGSADHSFPATYEILVLDAQNHGAPGYEWNHGYSYGIAVDSERSEVVYWAEDW